MIWIWTESKEGKVWKYFYQPQSKGHLSRGGTIL